jgi:hypothetical protein
VAYFGGKFWATTNSSNVISSTDGITWASVSIGGSVSLTISGDDSGNIVVGCNTGYFTTSSNGGASFAALSQYDTKAYWLSAVNNGRQFLSTMASAGFQHAPHDELLAHVKDFIQAKEYIINYTGDWDIGGFDADTGLSGRKIVIDNYGPTVPVGGGSFSGKCRNVIMRKRKRAAWKGEI